MSYIHKTTCRICSSADLVRFLSLGDHPPVDNFTDAAHIADEKRYPLDVYFCRACTLVQLLDVVSPKELFHNEYAYFSSASEPLVRHFESYAARIKGSYLRNDDLVVDIGSNDGVLLQFFKAEYRVLGVEPSDNVARVAREKGIETITKFFTVPLAEEIVSTHGRAQVVTANNVFAHIDDIDEIVRAVKVLMSEDGIYVFEAHYLLDLIQKREFDTVYHEHLCYYSVQPLITLFARFGMQVFDVERVAQHGGSIRVFTRIDRGEPANPAVAELLALEKAAGLHDEATFMEFQKIVNGIRDELVRTVRTQVAAGKKVVGYGAPAKGNTLLNFCGFTAADLAYITDTTPQKVGLLTPGSHIPVVSPEKLATNPPDFVLLLAWNYRDFILKKEQALRARGTKFIIPIPEITIV